MGLLKLKNNFDKWAARMPAKVAKQARFAAMQSLNDAAGEVQRQTLRDIGYGFDRPTPWVATKSVRIQFAKKEKLQADVYVDGLWKVNKRARGPLNTLQPHMEGGKRKLKGFESALQQRGLMPRGWYATIGNGAASVGAEDAFGNIEGRFITMLLSYFGAFGEQGYRANMTQKRKAKIAAVSKSESGYKRINGHIFFISYGKRGRPGGDKWVHGRHDQHLAPGIWAKTGTHGSTVKPIIMFVSSATYRQRIDMPDNARDVMRTRYPALFSQRFRAAMATAR